MTYFQIFSLIAGVWFLVFSVMIIKRSILFALIFFLVGGWLINQVLFGEVSKSDNMQREIKEIKSEMVEKILILPSKRRLTLTKDTFQIISKNELRKVQDCLSKTKETLRTNKLEDWGCILKICKTDKDFIFAGISKKGNQTILELYSEGEYGTNYGTMINNDLGTLIEEIIDNKKEAENKAK